MLDRGGSSQKMPRAWIDGSQFKTPHVQTGASRLLISIINSNHQRWEQPKVVTMIDRSWPCIQTSFQHFRSLGY